MLYIVLKHNLLGSLRHALELVQTCIAVSKTVFIYIGCHPQIVLFFVPGLYNGQKGGDRLFGGRALPQDPFFGKDGIPVSGQGFTAAGSIFTVVEKEI